MRGEGIADDGACSAEREREAREWVTALGPGINDPLGQRVETIKAMLARPTLPEEPSDETTTAIVAALWSETIAAARDLVPRQTARKLYRALYAHLTAPKTKTVWRVSWCNEKADTGGVCENMDLATALALVHDRTEKGGEVWITPREVPA